MKKNLFGTAVLRRGIVIALGLSSTLPALAETTIAELKSRYGAELEALGDVQLVDAVKGVIVVAGQRITISRQTNFSVGGVLADAAVELQSIKPGDFVAVTGSLGSPAQSIDRLNAVYIPGSTEVFVKGAVIALDKSIGVAKIDALTVDITPAMSNDGVSALAVGQVVEATGIQTSATAKMLLDRMSISGTSVVKPTSISGTSIAKPDSISGTSVVKPTSISGTSIAKPDSISGTSVVKPDSISGTSIAKPDSISGTSVVKPTSISGTSIVKPDSISGTSVVKPTSISGTSVAKPTSISGTSIAKPDSISGTSVVKPDSISGTSVVKPTSISGTSIAKPDSISGTS